MSQSRIGRLKELRPLRGACGVLDPPAPSPALRGRPIAGKRLPASSEKLNEVTYNNP